MNFAKFFVEFFMSFYKLVENKKFFDNFRKIILFFYAIIKLLSLFIFLLHKAGFFNGLLFFCVCSFLWSVFIFFIKFLKSLAFIYFYQYNIDNL